MPLGTTQYAAAMVGYQSAVVEAFSSGQSFLMLRIKIIMVTEIKMR